MFGVRAIPKLLILLVLLATSGRAFASETVDFVWEGRLTRENGSPLEGPVALTISFFHGVSDADPVLSVTEGLDRVPLLEGIFQVKLTLSSTQYATVFPGTHQPVFVQVTNRSEQNPIPFPRQQISIIPYAARVPVDDSTVGFDTRGRLTVQSVPVSSVTGLQDLLGSRATHREVQDLIATGIASGHTHRASDILDLAQILASKASIDERVAGDVGGTLTGTVVTGLRGLSLPPFDPVDAGKVLQFTGSGFAFVRFGTVSSVTAALPLTVTNPTTTPRIEIRQATGSQSGFLRAEDFATFMSKQNAITAATSVTSGSITTSMADGIKLLPYGSGNGETGRLLFQGVAGNTVGFRAPTTIPSSTIWTLPAGDGAPGQVLGTNGTGTLSWTTPLPSDKPSGTFPKVTVNSMGLVTSGMALSASDIPNLDASQITTGHIFVPGNPTAPLEAAPKQYVDAVKNAIPSDAKAALTGILPIDYSISSGEIRLKGLSQLGTANQLMGMNSAASGLEYKSLTGTDKQVSITPAAGSYVFSLPQNIANDSTPTFSGLTLSGLGSGPVRSSGAGILSTSAIDLASGDVSGVLPLANGGTGLSQAPTLGDFLAGDGSGGYGLTRLGAGPFAGVTASYTAGTVTLDTVQDIRTSATPTFTGMTLQSGGLVSPSVTASTFMGPAGANADDPGGTVRLSAGQGRGTGGSGALEFRTGEAGATSGSTLNPLSTRMTITAEGRIGMATAEPAGRLEIATGTASTVGLVVKATDGSQAVDLTQWRDATGQVLSKVDQNGFLTLPGAPTAPLQASTKGYVDGQFDALDQTLTDLTTSDVDEGSNLYFTEARARQALSGRSPLEYTAASGEVALRGLSGFGSANQLMGITAAGGAVEYKSLTGTANQVTVTHSAGGITLAAPQDLAASSSPTFSHLQLSGPTAGVMKLGLGGSVTTSKVDLTTTGVTEEVTGTLPVAKGGTGLSTAPTAGQLLMGNNASGYTLGNILAGTGIVVTNAAGGISIAASQGIGSGDSPSFLGLTVGSGGITSTAQVNTPLLMLGSADQTATPGVGTLRGAAASGTDKTGASLSFAAGNGTGTGGSGGIQFSTASPGSSGSDPNVMTPRMTITQDGAIGINTLTPGATLSVVTHSDAAPALILRPSTAGRTVDLAQFTTSSGAVASRIDKNGFFYQPADPTQALQAATKQYVDLMVGETNQELQNFQASELGAGGTTNQFWRGDKSWASVTSDIVEEAPSALYFTAARARGALTAQNPVSYNSTTGAIGITGLSGLGSANTILAMNNGATGVEYKTIAGTANQVSVDATTTPGTIKLATPQNIATTSSPTFSGLTLSGLAGSAGIVRSSGAGVLSSSLLDLNTDTSSSPLGVTKGGTGLTTAPTQGQLLIGTSGGGYGLAQLSQGSSQGVTIASGSGSVTLDTAQDIRASATPTFAGLVVNSGGVRTPLLQATNVRGTAVSGTDQVGTTLSLSGGPGTGTGASGAIEFLTGPAGSTSSSSENSVSTRMTITPGGNVGIATSAPGGRLQVSTGGDNIPGLLVRATNGTQDADLTQWLSSTGAVLSKIDKGGFLTLPGDPTSNLQAATKKYVDDRVTATNSTISNLTTSSVPEGTNLYFTPARAQGAISATAPLEYNSGVMGLKGLSTFGSANQILGVTAAGGSLEYKSLTGSSNIVVTPSAGGIGLNTAQGITTTDSPVFAGLRVSGLSTGVMKANATGTVSSSAVGLATSDVSGVLPIASGGTGIAAAPSNGQLLIGNTTTGGYNKTTLTAGTSISVGNGAGVITIDTVQDLRTSARPTFDGLTVGSFGVATPTLVAGTGDGTATATGGTVRAANITGTDILGKDLMIDAGLGTGSQSSGSIILRTAPAGGNTGTTANVATARLVVDPSGRVGIGSVAPNALLDVYGSGAVESKISSTSSTAQLTTNGTSGGVLYNTIGDQSITNAASSGAIKFSTNSVEQMRITSGGNVGIGTNNPSARAQVLTGADGTVGVRVQRSASTQTADLTQWLGETGTVLTKVDKDGYLTLPGSPSSTNQAATKGYVDGLISTANTSIGGKEPTITAGTTAQYWRGDKSWQTLNTDAVPEATNNKYFTDVRAKSVLSGVSPISYSAVSGAISLDTSGVTAGTYTRSTITVDSFGRVTSAGNGPAITSTDIADGAITNADINAAAGISDTKLVSITTAGKVANSATTATSDNTANAIVARDASGNFSAGTITANINGTVGASTPNTGAFTTLTSSGAATLATGSGNVGIGSATPGARLDVRGESRVGAAPATLTTVSGAHTNAVTTITVVDTTGYPSSGTLLINGEAISYTGTTTTTFTGCTRGVLGTIAVAFLGGETVDTYLSVARTSATAPKMVMTASGNVGIGTTSPVQTLAVHGVGHITGNFGVGAAADSGVGRLRVFANTTVPAIRADQVGAGPAATFIGGNVGIGSTAPGAKLDVVGGGRFTNQNAVEIQAFGTAAGNTGELRFDELTANGSDYVGFKAPDTISSSLIWTLPAADGTGGFVLSTNGTGTLSWIAPTTGSVTNIATGTGLTGGPITSSGTISLANVGTAGTYTKVTTNAQGQVTTGASLLAADIPNLDASKITSGSLSVTNGGTGGTTAASARTGLGLGSASTLDVGTAASNVVQLDANAKLPAVDGTQVTGVVKTAGDTMTGALNLPSNGLAVGTNQLVVSGGNVGIGTMNPSSKIHVVGTLVVQGSTQNGDFVVTSADGTTGIWDFAVAQSNGRFTFFDAVSGTNPFSIEKGTPTNTMWLKSSGNVGIGTTAPSARLDVSGESRVGAAPATLTTVSGAHTNAVTTITVVSTTGYPSAGTLLINGEAISYTGTTATTFTGCTRGVLGTTAVALVGGETVDTYLSVARTSATAPQVVTTASGNVGIGTTAPSGLLQVGSKFMISNVGSLQTLNFRSTGFDRTGLPTGPALESGYDTTSSRGFLQTYNTANGSFQTTALRGNIEFLSTGSTASTLVKVDGTSGNVGIGLTAPTELLHMRGGNLRIDGSPTTGASFPRNSGTVKFYTGNWPLASVSAVEEGPSYGYQAGLGFYTNNGSSDGSLLEERVRITKTGNVGIGSSTPGAKLDVVGGGRFTNQNAVEIQAFGTAAGNTGELRFDELTANGSDYVGFKAPNTISSSLIWTLPATDGTGGFVLSTNGSGTLSWIAPTTGSVTNIATGTGLTGGPITSSGTISLANVGTAGTYTKVTTNAQGQVTTGASLLAADIPNLDASKITTGTLSVALGGTGATSFTNNGILVGTGSSPLSATVAGTQYQVLRAGASGVPAFGSINLDQSAAVTGALGLGNGGTGATTAPAARTNLGLGTASTLNVGTAASNVVQLDANAKLPAVDGTQVTGVVKTAGDTMTGALNLPSNGLAVGTNQLVVSGGNLGIGTTIPRQALQVNGAINTTAAASSASTTGLTLSDEDGFKRIQSFNLEPLSINPLGNNVILNATTGNVGIGSDTPGARLDVAGNIRSSGALTSTGFDTGGAHARFVRGDYGVIHRNDGANYLMLLTSAGGQYSSWNDLRPFAVNLATGDTTINSVKISAGGSIRGKTNTAGAVNTVDWSQGNVQTISPSVAAITFTNMEDGGTYTLVCTDTTAFTHTFAQSGLTFSFSPINGPVVLGSRTVYNFVRAGTTVFVTWSTGM